MTSSTKKIGEFKTWPLPTIPFCNQSGVLKKIVPSVGTHQEKRADFSQNLKNYAWHENVKTKANQKMKTISSNIAMMRERLINCAGLGEPFCIKKKNDEVVVTFVRGFADPDRNIVLISEQSHSRGMNFIEIKNIQEIHPWTQSAA